MKKQIFFKTIITVFILLFALSCNNNNQSSSNSSSTNFTAKKIAITYVKSPLNVPSIVEKEKAIFSNTFSKYNIPVTYSELTTGPEQTQALASGDIQFLYAVGATSVILAKANGADIKIINMYSRSPKAFTLFSQKGTSFTKADEVRGKKIAGPKGTILHELLTAYLNTLGLKESDVEFISMGIPESQAALVGGSVDMALLAGPSAYNMIKDGYNVVTTGEGLVDATIAVATSESFYNSNKVLVDDFINAQREVLSYIENNYDEAMAISAKETGLSDEAVKEMYTMYDFSIDITDNDINSMKKTEEFMRNNNMIETEVNIDDLIIK
ncbi:ABC transporter substrate-binding protein [Brachyspira hampsonii]|uniref:ABC transporter substrate-binding protein n=1 Tax=Brachyspira hampsonii TaxID=1287055 RepID=UPI000D371E33|nr:NrtA/SsuA/CpmA family ABC transporter substrate-binding protein [Brachyspira hampsonii]PTY41238.1 ABC transporter substrate-binding protein [Brachyspira hampsonii bv. II]